MKRTPRALTTQLNNLFELAAQRKRGRENPASYQSVEFRLVVADPDEPEDDNQRQGQSKQPKKDQYHISLRVEYLGSYRRIISGPGRVFRPCSVVREIHRFARGQPAADDAADDAEQ